MWKCFPLINNNKVVISIRRVHFRLLILRAHVETFLEASQISGHFIAVSNWDMLEQEMETVIKVLEPGPLGVVEHKFSAEEICAANATVKRAVENWRRNAKLEQNSNVLKDYIHK
ncbi:hypothetical protein LOK49_LG12G01168 [Camellia lanceoleosa]|uniref:Uncharacterized protein n=1 Tax=Camellia lanceoleosa TaxID=1840588 RepID=A0ACC0FP89_9ERIC|nr:hypothetical protein LOK49_LG12G01168 [Camellia lanceoleosa]